MDNYSVYHMDKNGKILLDKKGQRSIAVDDAACWQELRQCFNNIFGDLGPKRQLAVYQLMSAVLLIGNIEIGLHPLSLLSVHLVNCNPAKRGRYELKTF